MSWDNRAEVSKNAKSLFTWRFRCRRRHAILNYLLTIPRFAFTLLWALIGSSRRACSVKVFQFIPLPPMCGGPVITTSWLTLLAPFRCTMMMVPNAEIFRETGTKTYFLDRDWQTETVGITGLGEDLVRMTRLKTKPCSGPSTITAYNMPFFFQGQALVNKTTMTRVPASWMKLSSVSSLGFLAEKILICFQNKQTNWRASWFTTCIKL